MTTIIFSVPSVPVAQPRQRHRAINIGSRTLTTNYTPTKDPVNAYKAAVQLAARQAYRGPPLEGPLSCSMKFIMPRPKGMLWKKKPMPRAPHAGKPDRDNLMKSTQDALNALVWRDDSQIFSGPVEKWIAAGDEQPHVEIEIEVLEPTAKEPT